MRSPPSFGLAYLEEHKTALEIQKFAGTRLRTAVCQPNQWLFDDRIKPEESALAKLQLGPVPGLGQMQDIYAVTVVVPTGAEIDAAVEAIRADLPESEKVERRRGDPQTFTYDDVHLVAQLGKQAPGLAPGLRDRRFEIQVRTGLQYAWWRATHDVLYKGGARTWGLSRVASQVRASLEMLDAVLADLRTAATLLDVHETKDDKRFTRVAELLDLWPDDRRPVDVSRFYLGFDALANAASMQPDQIEKLLKATSADQLVANADVTPLQAVLGVLVDEVGTEVIENLPSRYYVLLTDELRSACPATDQIAESRRASLSVKAPD